MPSLETPALETVSLLAASLLTDSVEEATEGELLVDVGSGLLLPLPHALSATDKSTAQVAVSGCLSGRAPC